MYKYKNSDVKIYSNVDIFKARKVIDVYSYCLKLMQSDNESVLIINSGVEVKIVKIYNG